MVWRGIPPPGVDWKQTVTGFPIQSMLSIELSSWLFHIFTSDSPISSGMRYPMSGQGKKTELARNGCCVACILITKGQGDPARGQNTLQLLLWIYNPSTKFCWKLGVNVCGFVITPRPQGAWVCEKRKLVSQLLELHGTTSLRLVIVCKLGNFSNWLFLLGDLPSKATHGD